MKRYFFLTFSMLLLPTMLLAQATPTYRLQKVTFVAAGNLYVFEQSGRVMIGDIESNGIKTTDSYNTADLSGTEIYVWTLESANGDFYIKNISKSKYINNSSSTTMSLGSSRSSKWNFEFNTEGYAFITNTSNSNRYLGYASSFEFFYKAYTEENHPHSITVFQLVEEQAQQLTGIEVIALPTKLEYEEGEFFDPNGMVVMAKYELADGTTIQTDVTADCTFSPIGPLTTNNQIITISYQDKTATIQITVLPLPRYTVTLADTEDILTYNDDGSTVPLPVRENMDGYIFVGWSETECLEETMTCPEIISDVNYHPTKDVTLYPVFRTQSEESSEGWTLIRNLSAITSGTYVLIVELDDGWHAFNGTISSNGMGAATEAFSFNDGTSSTLPNNAAELTMTVSDEGIMIVNANDQYLTAKGTNTGYLKWDSKSDYWKLNTFESFAYLQYSDKVLRYSTSQSSPGFRGYYSAEDGMTICLARKGSVRTHYVTLPYHMTINSYATMFLGYNAIIPDGVEAFIATASDEPNTINLEPLTGVIPAWTGVVMKATVPTSCTLLVSEDGAMPCSDNLLHGVLRTTAVSDLLDAYEGKNLYGLQLRNGAPFFARLVLSTDDDSQNMLAAHRALLVLDGPVTANELCVGTGDVTAAHGMEYMERQTPANSYDLSGRRSENTTRGWVIENGRLILKR